MFFTIATAFPHLPSMLLDLSLVQLALHGLEPLLTKSGEKTLQYYTVFLRFRLITWSNNLLFTG